MLIPVNHKSFALNFIKMRAIPLRVILNKFDKTGAIIYLLEYNRFAVRVSGIDL
jgi:hypothetical protein